MPKQYYGDEDNEAQRAPGRVSTYSQDEADKIVSDILSGMSIYAIAKLPNRPGYSTIWRWRKEVVEFDDRVREAEHRRGPLKPSGRPPAPFDDGDENLRDVCKLLEQGATIGDACFMIGMSRGLFYDLMKRHPEFAAMVAEAREIARKDKPDADA